MRIGNEIPASALNSFSVDMTIRANNLANISTNGFQSQSVQFMDIRDDQGVAVGEISENTTPGPMVPGRAIEESPDGQAKLTHGLVEGGNTDPANEITHMIVDQAGFSANAQSMRTIDDMHGSLLDIIA